MSNECKLSLSLISYHLSTLLLPLIQMIDRANERLLDLAAALKILHRLRDLLRLLVTACLLQDRPCSIELCHDRCGVESLRAHTHHRLLEVARRQMYVQFPLNDRIAAGVYLHLIVHELDDPVRAQDLRAAGRSVAVGDLGANYSIGSWNVPLEFQLGQIRDRAAALDVGQREFHDALADLRLRNAIHVSGLDTARKVEADPYVLRGDRHE